MPIEGKLKDILDGVYLPDELLAQASKKLGGWGGPIYSLRNLKLGTIAWTSSVLTAGMCLKWWVERFELRARVYVCLVASPKPNACAMLLSEGIYCIALTEGLLSKLFNFARHIVTTDSIVIALGLDEALIRLTSNNCGAVSRKSDGFPDIEFENHHAELAFDLSATASCYIVFHKLAHIANGHLNFLGLLENVALAPNAGVIQEIEFNGPATDTLTKEALLYDADCFALKALINFIAESELKPSDSLGSYLIGAELFFSTMKLVGAHDDARVLNAGTLPRPSDQVISLRSNYLLGAGSATDPDSSALFAQVRRTSTAFMLAEALIAGKPESLPHKGRSDSDWGEQTLKLQLHMEKIRSTLEIVKPGNLSFAH